MMERIAYQISVTALLLTALAIIAMLAMGLTRAIANPSQPDCHRDGTQSGESRYGSVLWSEKTAPEQEKRRFQAGCR